jgi:hypothetical protein
MAYKFILSGSAEQTDDGRIAIQLTPAERDLVLSEMRTFLDSVQQITQGVANNDLNWNLKKWGLILIHNSPS